MTVESELTKERFKGLRRSTSTRVVDYRTIVDGNNSTPQSDKMMFLGGDLYDSRFAVATGEDSVDVYTADMSTGIKSKSDTYVGPAINEADIVRFDGLEKWGWRSTREDDYPEPASGYVVTPVQLKTGLA